MIQPLAQIALFQILGYPLVLYLGLITFACFCMVAYIGYLVVNGRTKFANHKRMVLVAFAVAIIHGLLGLSLYL
jgi:hypothetical protein